jgi:hypothetical protein
MMPAELKATGVMVGSTVAAFFTFFAGYNIFHFLCGDWTISTFLAGVAAVFAFRLIPVLYLSKDPEIFRPAARPYKLTPMYALTEVKDGISTQYFGERRWHLENVNPESMTLFYVCRFFQEMGTGEAATRVESVVTMKVQVTAVGELSTVQVDFDTIAGGVSQAVNDLCTATAQFIEQRLLKLSEQLNQAQKGEGA